MIATDEEALICDLAEVYHIYDYKQLPAQKVAVFSIGLRDHSRIKMRLANQRISLDQMLWAGMYDSLKLLVWTKTKDGQKGVNRPVSLLETFTSKKKEKKELVFSSSEEFERARRALLKEEGGAGEWLAQN